MPTPNDSPSPLAQALGRVPTGLYIVTTRQHGAPMGFVGSFVMQLGFEPPTMCVAIGKDRDHLAAIRAHGHFGLSILDKGSQGLMGAFFKKEVDPFEELATTDAPGGCPTLDGSLAWLECRVTGEHETPDHIVVFGTVEAGQQLREGEPAVHLRKNGLGY
jgi:flavin reductase (DIM6/NTAB) family NADH-FMN oxidoreductase RutF